MLRRRTSFEFVDDVDSRDAVWPFQAAFRFEVVHGRSCPYPFEAGAAIVRRATAEVCRRHRVTALLAARHEARAALGQLIGSGSRGVVLRMGDVELSVQPDVQLAARSHLAAVAENDRADELLSTEIERAVRFQRHVLCDRAAALAYWSMTHRGAIDHAVLNEVQDAIETIAAEARHDEPWREIAKILHTFVANLDEKQKVVLMELLKLYAQQFDQKEIANELAEVVVRSDI